MTTTTAIERMSDTRLQQRIDMNRDAKFGLEAATNEQLNVIFTLCKHLRLDPLTDLTLYQGHPWITIDGELRLLHRHPDFAYLKPQRALSEQEKVDGGWDPTDIVWETTIGTRSHGEVTQWGKITRVEIDNGKQKRTPHGMHPVEMAQKRSIARARKWAFGGEEQLDQTQIEEILATEKNLRGDPAKTKALAAKYVQVFGRDDDDDLTTTSPEPERDPQISDALIDNEHLLIDAKDIGVAGALKQFKADPSWPLETIEAANEELRARIHSHREL